MKMFTMKNSRLNGTTEKGTKTSGLFRGSWKGDNNNFTWAIFLLTCKYTVTTKLVFKHKNIKNDEGNI